MIRTRNAYQRQHTVNVELLAAAHSLVSHPSHSSDDVTLTGSITRTDRVTRPGHPSTQKANMGSPNPAYMYNWAAQNVLQSPSAPPTPRSWSDRRKEQFEPLDAETTKKIAKAAMSADGDEQESSAGSIFRTISTHRRRVSIGSLLSLPALSARGKQIKQRLIGGEHSASPPPRPRIVKRSSERIPLEDVAAFRVSHWTIVTIRRILITS